MRQVLDLGLAEVGARSAALSRVSFTQKEPDLAPVTVVQNQHRSDQVSTTFGAPGVGPVTGDAFGCPDLPATVSRRRIHNMFIHWSGSTAHDPWGRGSRGRALPDSATVRWGLGPDQINGLSILLRLC